MSRALDVLSGKDDPLATRVSELEQQVASLTTERDEAVQAREQSQTLLDAAISERQELEGVHASAITSLTVERNAARSAQQVAEQALETERTAMAGEREQISQRVATEVRDQLAASGADPAALPAQSAETSAGTPAATLPVPKHVSLIQQHWAAQRQKTAAGSN